MARIRSIKPEFWTDEKVVAMSPLARLLFIGLWNFADDEGRGELSPRRLKMQILPADSADMSALLGEIRRENLIAVYSVDGKEYFEIRGFHKHQKIDKRVKSRHPSPPTHPDSPRLTPTDQGMDQGYRIKEEGSETNVSGAEAPTSAVVPIDARTALFRDGLASLRSMTGRADGACRQLIGKWLKANGDDARGLHLAIIRAADLNPAEPVAWIEKSIRPKDPDAEIYRNVF